MKFEVGQQIMWSGAWGKQNPKPAYIVGIGEKNNQTVFDLDNGHWAYEYQLSQMKAKSLTQND